MSQNLEELHTLIRQLRTEIEWASRTGIEVAPPPAPQDLPAMPPPALEGEQEGPKVVEAPIPSPFEKKAPTGPVHARGKPPAKRQGTDPRRPWEAYVGTEGEAPPPVGATLPAQKRAESPRQAPRAQPEPRRPEAPKPRSVPSEAQAAPRSAPSEAPVRAPAVAAGGAGASRMPILHTELAACGSLSDVQGILGPCVRCKLHSQGRTKIVFGVGDANADVMFVGEGPGADEDRQGEPFVGKSGQLLTKIIESGMKMRRDDVYIANIVKCRPPKNRDPDSDEVQACEPFLLSQIRMIQPKVIVALGKYAAHTLLRSTTPITRLRGHWGQYNGIPLMPTYHPAYLLRSPAEKRPFWEDIQAVMSFIDSTSGGDQ